MARRESFHEAIERHRREGFGWRYDGFGDWTTEAIFAKLTELGIASDPEQFKRDAAAAGEPREISETWRKRVQTGGFWDDFPLLVPEELWRRLLADVPCGGILFGDLRKTLGDMDAPSADPVAVLERAADLAIRFADLARTRRPEAPVNFLREWEERLSVEVLDSLCDLPRRLQWEGLHAQAVAVTHACAPLTGAENMLGGLPLVLAREGKRAEAEAQIAQNEREMPASLVVRMGSAEAWEELGDLDRALRTYEEAERLAADKNAREWALECKADCLEDMGRKDEAREARRGAGVPESSPEADSEPEDEEDTESARGSSPPREAFVQADSTATEVLLEKLGLLGLPCTVEAVREAALAAGSALGLGEAWRDRLAGEDAEELLKAAPYVLWDRLLSDRPSAEVWAARLDVLERRIEKLGDHSMETLREAVEVSRRLLELAGKGGSPDLQELSDWAGWEMMEWMSYLPGYIASAGFPDEAIALTREWWDELDVEILGPQLVAALARTGKSAQLDQVISEDKGRFELDARSCLEVAQAWFRLGEWAKALGWVRSAARLATNPWHQDESWELESDLLQKLGRTEERRVLRRQRREALHDVGPVGDEDEPPGPLVSGPKVGRNDPCPCGSGKKYKKCCGK